MIQEERSVQPDVVPVGFDFDGEYLYVGGMNFLKSTKYRNVLKNNKVAVVIDDLKSIDPWDPRGIKIYGTADVITRQGSYMESTEHPNPQYIRVAPQKKWSWGIAGPNDLSLCMKRRSNIFRISQQLLLPNCPSVRY